MKNMNMKERYWTINLQLFAGDGGDDDPGDEGGDRRREKPDVTGKYSRLTRRY